MGADAWGAILLGGAIGATLPFVAVPLMVIHPLFAMAFGPVVLDSTPRERIAYAAGGGPS